MIDNVISGHYTQLYDALEETGELYKFELSMEVVPIAKLYTMDDILSNNLVATNVNAYAYVALLDMRNSITVAYERLEKSGDAESMMNEIKIIKSGLEGMNELIDIIKENLKEKNDNYWHNKVNEFYENRYNSD